VGLIEEILPAGEIIQRLVKEYRQARIPGEGKEAKAAKGSANANA
jgi:hypothetical protein